MGEKETQWFICYEERDEYGELITVRIPLDSMDIVGGVDPAATEKYISAKTSRTAVALWSCDADLNRYLVDLRVGYATVRQMFNWIFTLHNMYPGHVRKWILEKQGFQKVLKQFAEEERLRRKAFISFDGVPALGDKVVRIRGCLGPELEAGRIWVNEAIAPDFGMELKVFPQNKYRMDVLDASVHAIRGLIPPFSEEEEVSRNERDEEFIRETAGNVAGW